jgi:hypothetical protein
MIIKLYSKEILKQRAIERRTRLIEASDHPKKGHLLSELSYGNIPKMTFPDGFDLREHVRPASAFDARQGVLGEFIGTGNFGTEWNERQRYEVYAGRDEEPELWRAIYSETSDSTLPKIISVNRIGPGGVVFMEVQEGGEVRFASLESSDFTVRLVDYATGLEYSKELVKYNQLWDVAIVERQAGIAHNALQNHIHFSPIMNATYSTSGGVGTRTETDASTVGSNLLEKYMSTYEDAVQQAKARDIRGPYVVLTGNSNAIKAQKALLITIQDGNPAQSPVSSQISSVIEYDGWSGTRNGSSVSYPGVADNVGYLIGLGDRVNDFRSYENQGLDQMMGDPDVSRRIMAQTVWDLDRGVYCDTTAVQKINWPTS